MFKFPAAVLWIPSLANGYVAAMIAQFAWKGTHENFADFELAMLIAAISLPISILMVVGLIFWSAMRFAVRQSQGSKVAIGPLAVSALNVVAPVLLWFALKWAK